MKKLRIAVFSFLSIFILFSCKQKKEKPASERFFPVLSFIKSQVADIDTSLYGIKKIIYVDTSRSDTIYYRREQFRELASEFLSLPDLASKEYEDRFVEEKQFDETLNRAILRYKPVNPEKEEVQLQELLIRPDVEGDKITNIIIDYLKTNKDSSVQKRMLWQVDRSFQVTSTRQLPGQKETSLTYKVIWNDGDLE